jgi:glycosyltransferase involved in cell wall biosynthesis
VTQPKNKVLIVTYYWPPSAGSGVQRWLKFVKYLPAYGWEPYVFTPQNPSFAITDESLLKDVPDEAEIIHFPIWEPYDTFFTVSKWFGKTRSGDPSNVVTGKNQSLIKRVSTWIRGNVFIPDPRVFWVRPSVKFLHDFIADNHITKVVTTGPPHSMHLIGYNLKKKNPGITWLADFRDPWSEWGLLESLRVSKVALKIHRQIEKRVLTSADLVTTITPFYVRQFERLSSRKVHLLTNGYDEDDFVNLKISRSEKFVIRHVGIVNEKCNPRPFMHSVGALVKKDPEFGKDVVVEFIGEVHSDFKADVISDPAVSKVTKFTPSIPHKELLSMYGSSALLLLVLFGYKDAEGYMPGKLFEYLATGLPVLGVGPVEGDAAKLLNESGAGKMCSESDELGVQDFVYGCYQRWKESPIVSPVSAGFSAYSRRKITGDLTRLLGAQVRL